MCPGSIRSNKDSPLPRQPARQSLQACRPGRKHFAELDYRTLSSRARRPRMDAVAVVASASHPWVPPRTECPETLKAHLLRTRKFHPCPSSLLPRCRLSPFGRLAVRTFSVPTGSYLLNARSIGQDRATLLVRILSPYSDLLIGPTTDGVIDHGKPVIRKPQCPCNIASRGFKRVRTNDQCGFVVVFKGNAVMHTAR